MEEIRLFVENYRVEIILALAGAFILLFISHIVVSIRSKKSIKKYNQLVQGMDGKNIEEILMKIQEELARQDANIDSIEGDIKDIQLKLSFAIRKVGFMRYNAFDDMGSDLSFSMALLDDYKNGFVISSIYGRENTVSYGKAIKNGESKIPLSAEEILVIDRAIKGENLQYS